MIPNYLSSMWAAIAPGLANHLWQSTVFAVAVGLLTLILRNNHARIRYLLWLIASVKSLFPFSWLAGMGTISHGGEARRERTPAFTWPWISSASRFRSRGCLLFLKPHLLCIPSA